MHLGQKISAARKQNGFTQEALAEATNLSLSTIQRIEKGKASPRIYTLKMISTVLGIDLTSEQLTTNNQSNRYGLLPHELLMSGLFACLPPIHILFVYYLVKKYFKNESIALLLNKLLYVQLIVFLLMLLSFLFIPLLSYLFTGQKAYGHLNLPLFVYIFFVIGNLGMLIINYRKINNQLNNQLIEG